MKACATLAQLAQLLIEHPAGNTPRTHALLALMSLNAARLSGRVDAGGNILRLREQDRSAWNRSLIGRGLVHLGQSARGDELTEYHLEASIAACHCTAPDYGSTDWPQILALYDRLIELDASPVIALNRAVAVANVHGPEAGIQTVEAMRDQHKLESYYLLYAVLGEFEAQLNHFEAAADYFRKSIKLTATASEQLFLSRRLRDCETR